MTNARKITIRTGFGVLLGLMAVAVFVHSVHIRRPYFGELCEGMYEPITGESLKFARNWYREGAFKLAFLQVLNPASVEFPSLASRQIYYTVPPGAIIPLHIMAKVSGREPTPALIHTYNLANHCAICLMMCMFVYVWLLHCGLPVWLAWLFAIPAIVLELLLPGPLYWHQNLYYSDQAIVVWYVLAVMLEMLHDIITDRRVRHWITVIQCGVNGAGVLTDWSMLFLVGGIHVKRILCGQMSTSARAFMRESIILWGAPFCAGLFYVGQLVVIGQFKAFLARVALYSGVSAGASISMADVHRMIWGRYIPKAYGNGMVLPLQVTVAIVALGLLGWRWLRFHQTWKGTLGYCAVFLLPWLAYVSTFRLYTMQHDFAVQKASVVLGVCTFGLVPGMAARQIWLWCTGWQWMPRPVGIVAAHCAVVLLVVGTLTYTASQVQRMYPARLLLFCRIQPSFKQLGDFLSKHTTYEDIVVSPVFEVRESPAQMVASSMKRVYRETEVFAIYSRCYAGTHGVPYVLNVLVPAALTTNFPGIALLTAHGQTSAVLPSLMFWTNEYKDVVLWKIPGHDFERIAHEREADKIAYMRWLHQGMRGASGEKRRYLSEDYSLKSENLYAGRYGPFQRGRGHGGESITFWGFNCGHALCMMPNTGPVGRVIAHLGGRYSIFRSVVGVLVPDARVTFRVLADARQVFNSGEQTGRDDPLLIDADIRGCGTLELQVIPGVSHWGDHTVWVDPYVIQAADSASKNVCLTGSVVPINPCGCDTVFVDTLVAAAGASNVYVYSPAKDVAMCSANKCSQLVRRVYAPRLYDLYYDAFIRQRPNALADHLFIYAQDRVELLDISYRDMLREAHAIYQLNQRDLHVVPSETVRAFCTLRFSSTQSVVEQLRSKFDSLRVSNAIYLVDLPLIMSNFVYGSSPCVRVREDYYGCPIVLCGFAAAHGLSTHAPLSGTALLAANLNARFERFVALVGITDPEVGSAGLAIQLDDHDMIEYPELLSRGLPLLLDIDVKGVHMFKAYINNGSNRNPTCDSVVWIDPQFAPDTGGVSP